ncbi:unnamed protein product [Brachionus calyciflorus]|uniref:Uncharacterized protein n=1 Tax=Brachionus calyciflorus TaxID=104777 RepID=A0A814BA53_9BILA|nr:unnamed protein product [Brachionus calyciflorus]
MAAEAFINYYEKFSKHAEFDFRNFSKDELLSFTPKKIVVTTCGNYRDFVFQVRDGIISNLGSNPFFLKNKFESQSFHSIYSLLIETNNPTPNEEQMAQLIFALHLSKGSIEDQSDWLVILSDLDTISLKDLPDFELEDQFLALFEILKANAIVNSKIHKIFKNITAKQEECNFDIRNLKLFFFCSEIAGLNSFSGFDSIYVSINELLTLYRTLIDRKIYHVNITLILKFEFIRLFIHETFNVILRKHFNDLNFSSPKWVDKAGLKVVSEAGIFAERMFFGNRIDWLRSAKRLNYEYCSKFLDDLLKKEDVNFDFHESNCEINYKKTFNMAIDYKIPNKIFE